MNEFLTVEEIAAMLKLHPRTVLRMLNDKRLPGFKVANQWRVERRAFEAFLEAQKAK